MKTLSFLYRHLYKYECHCAGIYGDRDKWPSMYVQVESRASTPTSYTSEPAISASLILETSVPLPPRRAPSESGASGSWTSEWATQSGSSGSWPYETGPSNITAGSAPGNTVDTRESIINPSNLSYLQKSPAPYKLNIHNSKGRAIFTPISLAGITNIQKLPLYCSSRDLYEAKDAGLQQRPGEVPIINCDQASDILNELIIAIQTNDIRCSIFYSATQNGCALVSGQDAFKKQTPNVFTIANSGDAIQLVAHLRTQEVIGTVTKVSSFNAVKTFVVVFVPIIVVVLFLTMLVKLPRKRKTRTSKNRINGLPLVRVQLGTGETEISNTEKANIVGQPPKSERHFPPTFSEDRLQQVAPAYRSRHIRSDDDAHLEPIEKMNVSSPTTSTASTFIHPFPHRTPSRTPGQISTNRPSQEHPHIRNEIRYASDAYPFPIMESVSSTPLGVIEERGPMQQAALPLQNIDFSAEPPKKHHWRLRRNASSSSNRNIGVYSNDEEGSCRICLEDFRTGELLRVLRCKHLFHVGCIDPWLLKTQSKCPICRGQVFPELVTGKPGKEEGETVGEFTFTYVKERIRRLSESLRHEHSITEARTTGSDSPEQE